MTDTDTCNAVPDKDNILLDANRLTAEDRRKEYGHPLDNFTHTAAILNGVLAAIFERETDLVDRDGAFHLRAEHVPLIMQAVKLARLAGNPTHRDTNVDIAGYARTLELVIEERECRGAANARAQAAGAAARIMAHARGLTREDMAQQAVSDVESPAHFAVNIEKQRRWAEGLITQLPKDHDGRNSWLLNHGVGPESDRIREQWPGKYRPEENDAREAREAHEALPLLHGTVNLRRGTFTPPEYSGAMSAAVICTICWRPVNEHKLEAGVRYCQTFAGIDIYTDRQ